MFIHHLFKTPLKKKSQTITYQSNESPQKSNQNSKLKQKINQLCSNFNSLSSTIDIDITKNHFNLIQYQKQDQKIKYDPQIVTAKLRRLQNQAQINRIQMELQQRRKKKKSHLKNIKNTNQFQNTPYSVTYQSFLKNSKLIQMPQNDSQSQQDQNQPKPKGIARFHQLKKHNKILQYTMKKIKQKQQQSMKLQLQHDLRKQNVKNITNQLKDYGQFIDIIRKKSSSTPSVSYNNQINPQVIIQDKFKRIMTMKAKDKVSDQVKQNPRCNKMMNYQNDILIQLQQEQKSLSKQNMKKLKSRFIQIVNELHKGDKKRKQNKFFPSIQTVSFTEKNTARTKRTDKILLRKTSNTFNIKHNDETPHDILDNLHLQSKYQNEMFDTVDS